jgi:hypothetical protein
MTNIYSYSIQSHCNCHSFAHPNSGATLCCSVVDIPTDEFLNYLNLLVPGEGFEPPANGLPNHWQAISSDNKP